MSSAVETSNGSAATATEPRRLRGHKAAATCCIASWERTGIVATSGEDGLACWFDLRCKDVELVMDVGDGKEAVSSLCFKHGKEDVLFASLAKEVKSFDVRAAISQDKNTPSLLQNRGLPIAVNRDYSYGGHTASFSCVAFSEFDERGRFIISRAIKLWNVSMCLDKS